MRVAFLYNNIIRGNLPFGMTTVAAYIRDRGHTYDYFNSEIDYEELKGRLKEFNPGVVAYSASSSCILGYLEVNSKLKADFPGIKSIFGGPHPTLVPEMIKEEGVDAICRGEGEHPFAEYIDFLEKGREPTGIQNLWIKHPDGTIEQNPLRPFLQDLDSVPFADYSFAEKWEDMLDSRIGYIMASRGCPYKCTYCINHILCNMAEGSYIRLRSVDNVIAELKQLVDNYGIVYVNFQDDIFGLRMPWLEEFAEKFPREVGLPFSCHLTADRCTPQVADLLKKAGVDMVIIGVENGDPELRRKFLNKKITNEQILQTSRLLHERNIKFVTQNMMGIPGETIKTALSTIELNIKANPFVFNMWFFQPYPMIKLTDMSREMGIFPEGYEFPPSVAYHIALEIPNREALQLLGELSFYLVDHPRRFKATKLLATIFGGTWPTLAWLRRLKKIEGVKRRSFDHYYGRWVETMRTGGDPRSVTV